MINYDLVIIGAGWAGFNAALTAKRLGLKVVLIEKGQIGGTCLNLGCIPTKTLIQSAKVYILNKKSKNFGIDITGSQINFIKIQERKDKIIQQLRSSMQFMLRGIDFLEGKAQILSPEELSVNNQIIKTKFTLIATGAKPAEFADLKFDGRKIISSDDILNLKEIPKSLLIIGGGVIGCEFASLFSNLGTSVSIVEKMSQLLPGEDREIAQRLKTLFQKKGIQVDTNADARTIDLSNENLVLLCIGRVAETEGLGLDKLGLKLEKGSIAVDKYLKTSINNIYAAGDCTGKKMLAHFAAYQGRMAVSNISSPNSPQEVSDRNIPNCVFTDPEIASVGLSEEEARNSSTQIKINKFDFLGSGAARILDETDGFLKIISDKKTGQILGAAIIGPRATELIGILTLAVSSQLKISQVQDTIFAHPTMSESINDALKENHAV